MEKFRERLLATNHAALNHSGVDGERLAARLAAIAEIGLTEEGGSERIGFSLEEARAKMLVKEWMQSAGLDVREDGAGNVIGRLAGKEDLPVVACGSHVDTVPNGGHFDGVLGVLAALEVVEAWKSEGFRPAAPVEVFVFSDEEGTRFNTGYTGSSAMMGDADWAFLSGLSDQEGKSFAEVLQDVGISAEGFAEARRRPEEFSAYIELHIEQGRQLEKIDQPVAIVTGIAGAVNMELTFRGMAAHAGNTPMDDRCDALVAAGHFITILPVLAEAASDTAVATVGQLHVFPNGSNVVPGEVKLSVDLRDVDRESLEWLADRVAEWTYAEGVQVEQKETLRVLPVLMDEELMVLQEEVMRDAGLEPVRLPSGAGHDAMVMCRHMPAAMLFVRSRAGVSHHPDEWTDLADCLEGVFVLKGVLEKVTCSGRF